MVDTKTVHAIGVHYFTPKAKINTTRQPAFITGDSNGDGINDWLKAAERQ